MSDPNAGLPPRYLRTPEAAQFLNLSGRTPEKHRTYGTAPPIERSAAASFTHSTISKPGPTVTPGHQPPIPATERCCRPNGRLRPFLTPASRAAERKTECNVSASQQTSIRA